MAVGRHPKQYNVHPKLDVVCSDAVVWLLTSCTHRIIPARADQYLQPVGASKTEQLNTSPKDGTDVRRNAQGSVM